MTDMKAPPGVVRWDAVVTQPSDPGTEEATEGLFVDWDAELGVDLELWTEVETTSESAAGRRAALEAALDEAETVIRPPTSAEAGNPVGRTDAGAQDGGEPDPRPGTLQALVPAEPGGEDR